MADNFLNLTGLQRFKEKLDIIFGTKQDKLTAGNGIKIENDTISGTKVDVSKGSTNVIEVESYNSSKLGFEFRQDDIVLTASSPMVFGENRTLQEKLTAGDNITIENNTISAEDEVFVAVYEQTSYADLKDAIDANKVIVLAMTANKNQFCMTYSTYTNGGNALMYAIFKMSSDRLTLMTATLTPQNQWRISHTDLQERLVSGTNIKTINGNSVLGSGDLEIGGGTVDTVMSRTSENAVQNKVISAYVDAGYESLQTQLGILANLTTDDKTNLVNAINEVYEKSGEPFRVKNWAASWSEGVAIEPCTTDKGNTSLAKMTFSIDNVEGADYQIVGMIAYEVFDNTSGGNRLNVWPVCQFTGNGQKELSVRWVCAGTTVKTAKRINAWVLLKHR